MQGKGVVPQFLEWRVESRQFKGFPLLEVGALLAAPGITVSKGMWASLIKYAEGNEWEGGWNATASR